MSTLVIELTDEKRARLQALAKARGVSLTQFTDELYSIAIAQDDAQAKFRMRASQGSPERLAELLTKLDKHFEGSDTGA